MSQRQGLSSFVQLYILFVCNYRQISNIWRTLLGI